MKKFLTHKSIPFLTTILLICALGIFGFPHEANAQVGGWVMAKFGDVVADALFLIPGYLSLILLQILSLILYMAGITLNFIIQYTVVNMATNIDNASITVAWTAIRDVANMSFIFILLYAAIRTIIGMGSDMRKTIVSVIVVAILINFSLFFTKVVIDASNIVAITFYDVIAPGATDGGISLGLSSTLMEPLKLQTIMGVARDAPVNGTSIIIVGVVGSIFILIASFILFAISAMFVVRFVVLIFVMILSPIAFLAYALPELRDKGKKWSTALFSQALFAPVYFLIMWVVIVMIRGMLPNTENSTWSETLFGGISDNGTLDVPHADSMQLLMNFVIIIAFLIASLIISKEISSKGGGMIANANKWGSRLAGGASFGLAARAGRNTVGRVGAAIGDSEQLKDRAARGGFGGAAARLTLATGRKTSKASFDVRGTPITGGTDAGSAAKGGFEQTLKDKKKKEKDFADSLKPSDEIVSDAEREMERARRRHGSGSAEWLNARREVDRLKGVDEKEAIKRLQDERRRARAPISEQEAKDIINADRDRYISRGLGDVRRDNLVESLERSPTYFVANQVRKAADAAGEVADQITSRPANVVRRAKVRLARRIPRGTIRNIVRTAGSDVEGIIRSPGSIVRSTPNLVRAKNRAAIAEIRKGKKSARELFDEAIAAAGGTPGGTTTPPVGGTPGGTATPPAGGTTTP